MMFAVDSVYLQAVNFADNHKVVVDLSLCESALTKFVLGHAGIVKMTERRLATFKPVVTYGSENYLRKLMAAVVT